MTIADSGEALSLVVKATARKGLTMGEIFGNISDLIVHTDVLEAGDAARV